MGIFSRIAAFVGRGEEDALSIPPMDGVFKPNTHLDTAERVLDLPEIDNLATSADGALLCSSGNRLLRIDIKTATTSLVHAFDGAISMIAARPSGGFAVGVEGTGLRILDQAGNARATGLAPEFAACLTAGLFEDDDTLLLAIGSRRNAISDWKRDLMSHGTSGLIVRHSITRGESIVLAEGLAFPYGLAKLPDGTIVATESWRHRVFPVASHSTPILRDLPAYPARLSPASGGGYWLALFAPRRQLTELVLREDDYRLEMMETIPPEAWIGPDFADLGDVDQPLQSGSVRQMGIMKPWAPSRAYGLVVRLDAALQPVASYHSRADGKIHGIASVAELGGSLYAASRGAGALVRFGAVPGVVA
jgi:hypothetical protein